MASGAAHSKASIATAAAGGATAGYLIHHPTIGLLVGLGSVAGAIVSPDLDGDGVTESELVLFYLPVIGPLVGAWWYLLWLPYAKAVPHRSLVSHAPLVGTALRLLYLLSLFGGPARLLLSDKITQAIAIVVWVSCGLALSDTVHFLMDLFSSLRRGYRDAFTTSMDWRGAAEGAPLYLAHVLLYNVVLIRPDVALAYIEQVIL